MGGGGGGSQTDASTGGSSATGTLATGLLTPRALVLGPDAVYFTTANGVVEPSTVGDAGLGLGCVESVPRSGGAVGCVIAGLDQPSSLAVAMQTLVFAQGAPGALQLDAYTLQQTYALELATSSASTLPLAAYNSTIFWASGSPQRIELDSASLPTGDEPPTETTLFQATLSSVPVALATNGTSVFLLVSTASGAGLLQAPVSGGAPTEIWSAANVQPSTLVVDSGTVFWTLAESSQGGEVLATAATGGGEVFTLASNVTNVQGLAAASGTVYFTSDVALGEVLAVSSGGGQVSTIASGLDYPAELAVDDAVYVATANTIEKFALP